MKLVATPSELNHASGESILLIPEIGLAHLGSLNLALNYIDLVAKLGLKVVKFQHHDPRFESSLHEEFRVNHPHFTQPSRYQYWQDTSFTSDQWLRLYQYTLDRGLAFSITPNSYQSACFIYQNIPPSFWKIGSSDFLNFQLIDFLVETDLPIIISTGLSTSSDIKLLLTKYPDFDKFIFLSCISSYPSSLSDFNVSRLKALSDFSPSSFVGLSDHSSSVAPILLSYLEGYRVFEFHLTLSSDIYNFDLPASLTPSQVSVLLSLLDDFSLIDRQPSVMVESTNPKVQRLFSKVICSSRDLKKGHVLTQDDVCMLRGFDDPQFLSMSQYHDCIGNSLACDVAEFTPLQKLFIS